MSPVALAILQSPRTRGDCLEGGVNEARPCPWNTCRHHVESGSAAAGLHARPIGADTCALDVADRGEATLDTVGDFFGVTRERARQMEAKALPRLRKMTLRSGLTAEDAQGFTSVRDERAELGGEQGGVGGSTDGNDLRRLEPSGMRGTLEDHTKRGGKPWALVGDYFLEEFPHESDLVACTQVWRAFVRDSNGRGFAVAEEDADVAEATDEETADEGRAEDSEPSAVENDEEKPAPKPRKPRAPKPTPEEKEPTMATNDVTPEQEKLLGAIRRFIKANQRGPTLRDLLDDDSTVNLQARLRDLAGVLEPLRGKVVDWKSGPGGIRMLDGTATLLEQARAAGKPAKAGASVGWNEIAKKVRAGAKGKPGQANGERPRRTDVIDVTPRVAGDTAGAVVATLRTALVEATRTVDRLSRAIAALTEA